MENIDINKTQEYLALHLKNYIEAITIKYGKYIPQEKLDFLKSITDYKSLIRIYDYGEINAYANEWGINMPLCADKLLTFASKIPGYGINKNHMNYNKDTLINNDNTYINYIYHVFVSGTNTKDFFDDNLLHETMHFCGSGGATSLKEGINELLTRKIALEKGFRTSGCGYPKEVQIAFELQNIFGEEIIDQIAFINNSQQIYNFLKETLGTKSANLYLNVSQTMEQEFDTKYYANMESYKGITGIIKKTKNYKSIDYSNIYKMLNEFNLCNELQGEETNKKEKFGRK